MARAAIEIMRRAVGLDLSGVAGEVAPAFDLVGIDIGEAATHIIATIPLEPAARVGRDDPALLLPHL